MCVLLQIFGATDEDMEGLRIVSLYDMDLDKMESLMTGEAAGKPAAEQQQDGSSDSSSSQTGTDEKR